MSTPAADAAGPDTRDTSADSPTSFNSPSSVSFDIVNAVQHAVAAAQEAHEAARADARTPAAVRDSVAQALEVSKIALAVCQSSKHQRQSFAEFTTLLGEEMKDAADMWGAEGMKYAERSLRKAKSLVEDHFSIDDAFRMIGPLQQDANLARDVHDYFNLIFLLPVNALDLMNWSSPLSILGLYRPDNSIFQIWDGQYFMHFWWATFSYFILDLLFIAILPRCVKSPGVILGHHLITLAYIFVPIVRPEYNWLMGSNMLVEINTWFLIARRACNRAGVQPFTTGVPILRSFFLRLISCCFYVTWVLIRLVFYPFLLVVITKEYADATVRAGTPLNLVLVAPLLQGIFVYLNLKWSVDLMRSFTKRRGGGHKSL